MKNKMIYALGAMMLVGVASCDLTEKPSSFYEKDTYFVTEGKAQMAVGKARERVRTVDDKGFRGCQCCAAQRREGQDCDQGLLFHG